MGTIFPAPGFCDELQYLFVARGLSPSKLDPDEDEFIEVKEFSLQQLKTAVSEGQLQDAKSLALILRGAMVLPELQGLI
jgi:ADP-ribose pyrophosphatase